LVDYSSIKHDEKFSCFTDDNFATIDNEISNNLDEFKSIFEKWILDNEYNLDKIKTLTALIYINMAPLHEKKVGEFFFFKGKLMLQEIYDKNK